MANPASGVFQQGKENAEKQVVLHLLSALDQNPEISQRKLASDLGIALGLINTYLKKCMVKGWVRVSQVSAKRLGYFLTAEGFSEKSKMVKECIARSLGFFRDAKIQCDSIFEICEQKGFKKIALIGDGDLKEIARLVASVHDIEILEDITKADAVVITDVINPQQIYEGVIKKLDAHKVFTPCVLHISRRVSREV